MQPCAPARCSDDGRGSSGRAGQGQLFSPCVYRTLYRTHMHPHPHTQLSHAHAHTCTRTHTSMFDSLMRVLRGRTRTRAIGPVTGTCITAVLVCPHIVCVRVCVCVCVPTSHTQRPLSDAHATQTAQTDNQPQKTRDSVCVRGGGGYHAFTYTCACTNTYKYT